MHETIKFYDKVRFKPLMYFRTIGFVAGRYATLKNRISSILYYIEYFKTEIKMIFQIIRLVVFTLLMRIYHAFIKREKQFSNAVNKYSGSSSTSLLPIIKI
jgi:hypothetical protein